jgi:hypothetical protein
MKESGTVVGPVQAMTRGLLTGGERAWSTQAVSAQRFYGFGLENIPNEPITNFRMTNGWLCGMT